MNVKLLGLTIAGALALSATAQELHVSYAPNQAAKNVTFKKNHAYDNWFIQGQGGFTRVLGFSQTKGASLCNTCGTSFGLGVGKWHSPYFATRLMVDWNIFHDLRTPLNQKNGTAYTNSFNPHFDFIFDLNNYFGVYNPKRVVSVRTFLGVGYAATHKDAPANATGVWDKFRWGNKHTVTANTGVSFDVRLAKRVSFNLSPSLAFGYFNTYFPNSSEPIRPKHIIGQLRAGLTFDLGRTDWEAVEPMDYNLINDLNAQINKLRAENSELAKRPVRCPECPEVVPAAATENIINNVVFFRLNSAHVDRNQLINIFNTAQFVKDHKIAIVVSGYADEKTGTSKYNMSLSEKRARAVARILVEKYGVPSDLITIDWKGSDQQPYSQNAWNRVVIMKANK